VARVRPAGDRPQHADLWSDDDPESAAPRQGAGARAREEE
jgi:hypothetical protein